MQLLQIRRSRRILGGPWKDEVGNIQIAGRPVIGGRTGIQLAADPERRLANFIRWPNIAQERRIQFSLIDHHRAISELRLEGMARLAEHKAWQDDIRIRFGDQEAVFLQVVQFLLHLVYLILQDLLALDCRGLRLVL